MINVTLLACKISTNPSTASIRYPRPVVRFWGPRARKQAYWDGGIVESEAV